jgi:DNA gyrase subunit A
MKKPFTSSDYLLQEGRSYALYTIQFRAIPYITDGVKPGMRRVLWCARNGDKYKSATLAGLAVPLHPHAPPEDSIDTITGGYVNNIPLFDGYGVFGTLINPTAFGASRYTSIKVSSFTKDVVFRDIEIIPMVPNYDSTEMEPKHFLPLIPVAILNPTSGIAMGYATDILPRTLKDIVESQLEHLAGKEVKERAPHFQPTHNPAIARLVDKKGVVRWHFRGEYKTINTTEVQITKLPYGVGHQEFIDHLHGLLEAVDKEGKDISILNDVIDSSKDVINILVKFKRGALADMSKEKLDLFLGIDKAKTENLTLVDFSGDAVTRLGYVDIIKQFTDWRLQWYTPRYERLLAMIEVDIRKYDDIILSIRKNVAGASKKTADRTELKEYIEAIGVFYVDYIADLPIYKFTEEELRKVEEKRLAALVTKQEYQDIIGSDTKRKNIYISELKEVLKKFG